MGRGRTRLQVRPSQLLSFVIRFSGPMIVLTSMATAWMATAWTDTITLKSATSSFSSTHQLSQAPMARRIGRDGRPLRGLRNDHLLPYWSGYVVTGGPYTSAQATWTVPAVSYVSYPDAPQFEAASNWVGIDGYNEDQLIQLGTQQSVSKDNVASYSVWYEFFPPVQLPLMPHGSWSAQATRSPPRFNVRHHVRPIRPRSTGCSV